ncbi:MAG: DUF2145 domain-containing protein [Burkholderiales bacterium]|nr:DUF2145 domain-containing protein [Burkholderiales bacterium]
MTARRRFFLCVLWLALALPTTESYAGRACEEPQLDPNKLMQELELAQKTKLRLDQSQAEVAIIARVGQDLSKYHLRYSHLGLVRRQTDGRWNVLHELNQCGTAESELFDEGLGNFFMDDPFALETLILIPAPAVQAKLRAVLESGQARQLHQKRYNMLAYAYSTAYQNSNQWGLEVLAAALAGDVSIAGREQAQAWLKLASYQPTTLQIPAMTRLGARVLRANVSFDDHPMDRRMAGQIATVTVESVASFLLAREPATAQIVLSYP